jgi:hypothetical protein
MQQNLVKLLETREFDSDLKFCRRHCALKLRVSPEPENIVKNSGADRPTAGLSSGSKS